MRLRYIVMAAVFGTFGILVGVFFTVFLHTNPPPLTAEATSNTSQGLPVQNVTLTTVGAVGAGPHPNWVSYLPTTFIYAKANTVIHMEIDQQDGDSGVRNQYVALVRGVWTTDANGNTLQNTVSVKTWQGKPKITQYQVLNPDDSNYGPAHSFTIPDLGVSVPLMGVANPDGTQTNVITFDFKVPGPGLYRWQCFVPCAAGTLYGNGGPMQTLGYMDGELVVS